MQAFLLAAGHGTRLRPLTDDTPKCLLPVRGVPLLQIWLDLCRRSGITRILLNAHAHADAVRQFAQDHRDGLDITVFEEPELLGSAGTVKANRDWVTDEYFWILYADVLTNFDLRQLLNGKLRSSAATLGVCRVPDPSRCGIAVVDANERITQFIEKPKVPNGNLAFAGVLAAGHELLEALPEHCPADLGFDVLPRLVGRMSAHLITDYLLDIGTADNYQYAQKTWPGLS